LPDEQKGFQHEHHRTHFAALPVPPHQKSLWHLAAEF
jgi:hypothetical protein